MRYTDRDLRKMKRARGVLQDALHKNPNLTDEQRQRLRAQIARLGRKIAVENTRRRTHERLPNDWLRLFSPEERRAYERQHRSRTKQPPRRR